MTFDDDVQKKLDDLKKQLVQQQNQTNRVEGRASEDRAK